MTSQYKDINKSSIDEEETTEHKQKGNCLMM
jgi:hypothetical protein